MNGMAVLAFMIRPEFMWRFTGSDKSAGMASGATRFAGGTVDSVTHK
jgi:hypothetical protein